MTRWRQIALAILIVVGAALCLLVPRRGTTSQSLAVEETTGGTGNELSSPKARSAIKSSGTPLADAPEQQSATEATTSATRSVAQSAPNPAPSVPETPESSSLPPMTILENMRTTLRQYDSMFGENPVGTNPEITRAFQGDNPRQINFLKQDGNRVNVNGELVDPWGTPYFFHQISAHEMEIRSAGPDRVMYTADDLITR